MYFGGVSVRGGLGDLAVGGLAAGGLVGDAVLGRVVGDRDVPLRRGGLQEHRRAAAPPWRT